MVDRRAVIDARLVGGEGLAARLAALPEAARDGIGRAMLALAQALQRKIQTEKLSGQVLGVGSGALRAGIGYAVADAGARMTLTVGSAAPYARFQEYGTASSYQILPRAARVLAFPWKGERRFFTRVTHPPLPERSFLRSALAEFEPQIAAGIEGAVEEALRR
jgi:Bacteriophage HK97-gp10, putative tail-component